MTLTERVFGNDTFSADGAYALKQRIERYWANRGFTVQVRLVDGPFHPAIRAAIPIVKSDMVNGFPRELFDKLKGAA